MRALLIPAAFAAILAVSPTAFAAQMATGHVKSFDLKARTLTLNDGTTYMLPAGFKNPGLKAGEKVQLSWDMQNGKHTVNSVKIEQ